MKREDKELPGDYTNSTTEHRN